MYCSWKGMLMRCYNVKGRDYSAWGGRGIRVCERWHQYIGFLEDMGPTWRRGLSIERLDNNGDYTPENCIWATMAQQANNRRNTVNITVDGVTLTATQWERRLGFRPTTIHARLKRGWTPEAAVKTPLCH